MMTLLLLLSCALVQNDPCACFGCPGVGHLAAIGSCAGCGQNISSMTDKLCRACARSKKACVHCGKQIRNVRAFVGTTAAVDKQPRAGLEYFVLTSDDGKPQGVYHNPKILLGYQAGVRAIVAATDGPKGELLLRTFIKLEAREKDLEVQGESAKPVRWRMADVTGPEVAPVEGKYRITLPAAASIPVEVVCGEEVLSRHVFEKGAWKAAGK